MFSSPKCIKEVTQSWPSQAKGENVIKESVKFIKCSFSHLSFLFYVKMIMGYVGIWCSSELTKANNISQGRIPQSRLSCIDSWVVTENIYYTFSSKYITNIYLSYIFKDWSILFFASQGFIIADIIKESRLFLHK